uniref:ANK_REP_REGION domain-containing protein n=1 Tax=Trichuris muris TaxID=70415 RepID=A0A5S6Q5V5_TRIMR
MSTSTKDPETVNKIFRLIDENKTEELDFAFAKNENLVNVENEKMLTPLMYALLMKKNSVVLMLVGRTFYRFKDTLLIAIIVGNNYAVKMLIKQRSFMSCNETPLFFPRYMTPLMLAANYDNYSIVKLLIDHGETLEIPHRPDCRCRECKELNIKHGLIERAACRLYTYRALCSHAFLLHKSIEDPIMYAFVITRDLEKCQESDPDHAELYAKMMEHVKQLPLALINCCETSKDIILILSQKKGCLPSASDTFARLRLAIDAKQHEKLLDRKLGANRRHDKRAKGIFFLYEITNGCVASSYDYPFARFLSNATSYLTFIACLIFFTQYKEGRTLRGAPDSYLKTGLLLYIWIYVFAMFVTTWIDLVRLGFRRFLCAWWRWYDFIQMITFFLAFNALLVSCALTYVHGEQHAHRVHWDSLHPTLVFETLFTIAAILSSFRLFYFMQVLETMGPLIISIGDCVKDILAFLLFFFVVIGSFALGLNFLIEHYKYNVVIRDGKEVEQPFFMTSIIDALRYLYWAWFGYLDPERFEIIVGNYDPSGNEAKHAIVQYAAEFLSALYYIILVVSLLNLMISIMATTAQSAIDKSRAKWLFISCIMWFEYFDDSRTLPPPFCLVHIFIRGTFCAIFKLFVNSKEKDIAKRKELMQEQKQYMELLDSLKKRIILRHHLAERIGVDPSEIYATGQYTVIINHIVL